MSKSTVSVRKKRKHFSYFDVLQNLFPWKGDPVKEKIRKIVFLISVIVFSVCAYYVFDYYYENYKNNKLYDDLRKQIPELSEMISPEISNSVASDEIRSEIQKLMEINGDIVGYIRIRDKNGSCADTQVDYPILQKTNEEESEFYLNHNLRNEWTDAGSIFLDWRNVIGTADQSDNLIVYGHQRLDGSMFGSLSKYKEYNYFYGEHPCIELTTRYDQSIYKIFGFFYAYGGEGENDFDYFNHLDFYSEEDFYWYVNQVKRRTFRVNDVDVKYGDDLLTLSTCSTDTFEEARFVVVARKLRPGEDLYSGTENSSTNTNVLYPDQYYKESSEEKKYDESLFVPYGG